MKRTTASIAPMSKAASSARRLSLRATEELVRQLVDQVAKEPANVAEILADHREPAIAFTPDRRMIAANQAAEVMFGYGRKELDAQPTDILVPVRLRQPDAPPIKALDTLTTIELPGLRRDGSEPALAWTFGATLTTAEPIFVMVVRDRADIDDALEALYASEQRFRFLVEGVRDHAIILLDANGRISTWNEAAERIKGWSADEIIGHSYEMFFPVEDRAAGVPADNLAAAVRAGEHHVTGWRVRKDGSRFFAEASIWPLHTHDGTLQGYAKITHDLTAARLAEEMQHKLEVERAARAASEAGRDRLARLHRAAQALSRASTPLEVSAAVLRECLVEVDAAGGAIYVINAAGTALEVLDERGHPPGFLEQLGPLTLDRRAPSTDVVRARTPLFFENAATFLERYPSFGDVYRSGGFEATAAIPLIVREVVLGVIAIRYRRHHAFAETDRSLLITMGELCAQALERARLLESQIAARAEAEAASRAKDEFLAMLGHELRNPLAPIATAVELMKFRGETHSIREREVIERQLGHITRLVDDLLDISRITRGRLELTLRPVELADVIGNAVEIVSPLLEQRHHRLTMTVPRGLMVNADPARLAQIVSNLLSNAAKYTRPNGHIELCASGTADEAVIQVRDNGEGISSELLPRIFDLFVQGKRTFDRSDGGLGIGLSLVKNLVALHGGTASVTSKGIPGEGSEFTIRLPRFVRAAAPEPEVRDSIPSVPMRKRVLVVDDNRDFAEMLAATLVTLGYEVTMAGDAIDALERLKNFEAEAAVLDLGLPVLDGFELARRIQQEFPERTPRLIAVTGYGQQHDRDRSAGVGFADHLVKPIDIGAVVAALERS